MRCYRLTLDALAGRELWSRASEPRVLLVALVSPADPSSSRSPLSAPPPPHAVSPLSSTSTKSCKSRSVIAESRDDEGGRYLASGPTAASRGVLVTVGGETCGQR